MALVIIKTLARVCLRGANYFPGNPIMHVGNTVAHTSLSVSRMQDTARDTALGFNEFKHCNKKRHDHSFVDFERHYCIATKIYEK